MSASATGPSTFCAGISGDDAWRVLKLLVSCTGIEDPLADAETHAADEEDRAAAWAVYRDPQLFLSLYRHHYDRILNYLLRRTGNQDLAEDLTARTFHLALDALTRRPQSPDVRPWLYRIATNVHLSHVRSSTGWLRRIEAVGREWMSRPVPLPDAKLRTETDAEQVRRHLDRLSEADRTALLLRYFEELPYAEIGRVLGVSEVGARSRVLRALRKLEATMRQERSGS